MMDYLGVETLTALSPMIQENERGRPVSPRWIEVYRELVEWAILFHLVRTKDSMTHMLLVFDGLLRGKVFSRDLFPRLMSGIQEAIEEHERRSHHRIYLVGVAKRSKVLDRYRLAMTLEEIMTTDYPASVEIPREIEENAYLWSEYALGADRQPEGASPPGEAGGKMFFVKFGSGRRDPIWPVDIFLPQREQAAAVLGYLLADAVNGFPIPFYPLCLQRAHQHAALAAFDFTVLQDQIFAGIREILGAESPALDTFRLQDADPARLRYEERT
jgi:hypothetical protein